MGRKGITPLIAAVLLLAVTVSAAALFSSWGPSIVKTVTSATSNQTERAVDCNAASIDIMSAKYYSSGGQTAIVIRNTGQAELNNLRASAWANEIPINETTTSLARGNLTTVNVTTNKKPDLVQVFSKKCGSVTDKKKDIN
ncbi:MAG: archaellin/type IV pilin N-terminal domain-containing protein [Candidatus Nanohaloarchaea archaeon]